jgi:hypothetical protein
VSTAVAQVSHRTVSIPRQVFDFELSSEDMAALGALTTPASIEEFKQLYEKCTVRDTPLAETKAGVKTSITYD